MNNLKAVVKLSVRFGGAIVAMFFAYIISNKLVGPTNIVLTPEEMNRASQGFVMVSIIEALLLSFLIVRSPWRGLKLISAVILVHFGVETFMAQIETLYFNSAVQMGAAELASIVAAGGMRASIFGPVAVLIFGKVMKSEQAGRQSVTLGPIVRSTGFVALVMLYVAVYFLAGYFIAWQWEETRLYYSGASTIKPFVEHFWDLFVQDDPFILFFQLFRGAIWTLLALTIVRMMKAKRWEVSIAVAFTFAVFLGLPLGLFPNPYMPPPVAKSHFIEIFSSMLLFGGIAGWVLYGEVQELENSSEFSKAIIDVHEGEFWKRKFEKHT